MEVECHWSVELNVSCPHCGEYFDYLNTDHHNQGGFESLRDVAQSCTVRDVYCPKCDRTMTLKVQSGL